MIASRQRIDGADVARHYDELDRFYRDIWGEHVHHGLWITGHETRDEAVRQLTDLVAREAQLDPSRPGARVIDIGCGYGATARLLASDYAAVVTGITISPAQHAIADGERTFLPQMDADERRSSHPSSPSAPICGHLRPPEKVAGAPPRFLLGDWLQNELPDAAFDAAIAVESSEHMPDKARFFAQAHRVLRPGGRLVVCAWLAAEHPTARQERWLLEPISREGRMPHLGSETDYRALATAAGFRVAGFQDVTRQIARTWPMIVRIFLLRLLQKPAYLRFLLDRHASNRVFALTILRLCVAFRTGAMRYGVFTLLK